MGQDESNSDALNFEDALDMWMGATGSTGDIEPVIDPALLVGEAANPNGGGASRSRPRSTSAVSTAITATSASSVSATGGTFAEETDVPVTADRISTIQHLLFADTVQIGPLLSALSQLATLSTTNSGWLPGYEPDFNRTNAPLALARCARKTWIRLSQLRYRRRLTTPHRGSNTTNISYDVQRRLLGQSISLSCPQNTQRLISNVRCAMILIRAN